MPKAAYGISFSEYEEYSGSASHYKPIFEPGTCLSAKLYPRGYGAVIVLSIESGFTLLGGLKGVYEKPPTITVCERKDWYLTHHNHNNTIHIVWCDGTEFAEHAHLFEIIGKIEPSEGGPRADLDALGVAHGSWGVVENQIWLQEKWDENHR